MNLKDLRNMDKDDILEMMGLQSKQTTTAWLAGALGTFGVGLLVGAGIALLLAPKPGRELREDIRGRFRRNGEDRELPRIHRQSVLTRSGLQQSF
jgi:hypothetical protein